MTAVYAPGFPESGGRSEEIQTLANIEIVT
jgi:hypothetical protein